VANRWGYKNKTKWILIEEAPLTKSGLNEILFAATTKKQLIEIAKLFDLKLTGRNSWYSIVKQGEGNTNG
jgi:hypothetical protein